MSRQADTARRWAWPVLAALAVVAAGAVVALLQPAPAGYLDPSGTGPTGARALADLLTARGQQVLRVASADSTTPNSATQNSGTAAGSELELVTSPNLLTSSQLAQVARFGGDILVVDPDPAVLRALAPAISVAGYPSIGTTNPDCATKPAADASLTGDAYLGGVSLTTSNPAAQACYPGDADGYYLSPPVHGYDLIRYADGARTITVLGSGAPLTNAYLATDGDAALALNLTRQATEIVWLVPAPTAGPPTPPTPAAPAAPGQRSLFALLPWPVYLIAAQLAVAVLLAAAWRARRLGPLVAERLPVVVRASETVDGHGRLYQALRARDGAAEQLRAAARRRIARLAGDVRASPETIATRTGQAPAEIADLLYGPPPTSDQALVTLAAELDNLERKIRTS